ncbi:MAG: DNA polymerase III subunit chi [Parahaliea sp.]
MTRVGFYVVQSAGDTERLRVAARLADKAFGQGHRVFINTASETQARELDTLLWSYRATSFLPHALAGEPGSELVAIGWGQEPDGHDDLLINLQLDIPAFFGRFQRVAEVVTQDEEHLAALRRSWRFYRERGYPLEKYDLPPSH